MPRVKTPDRGLKLIPVDIGSLVLSLLEAPGYRCRLPGVRFHPGILVHLGIQPCRYDRSNPPAAPPRSGWNGSISRIQIRFPRISEVVKI